MIPLILAVITYFVVNNYLIANKNKLKKRYPVNKALLKFIITIHNAGLAIFSILIFYNLYVNVNDWKIFENQYCFLFMTSKMIEFFNDWFVLLHGEDIFFIQKYSHVGGIIVWYLCIEYKVPGLVIPVLYNSLGNALIYIYLILDMYSITTIYTPIITIIQMVKLIMGNYHLTKYYLKSYISITGLLIIYTYGLMILYIVLSVRIYLSELAKKICDNFMTWKD